LRMKKKKTKKVVKKKKLREGEKSGPKIPSRKGANQRRFEKRTSLWRVGKKPAKKRPKKSAEAKMQKESRQTVLTVGFASGGPEEGGELRSNLPTSSER